MFKDFFALCAALTILNKRDTDNDADDDADADAEPQGSVENDGCYSTVQTIFFIAILLVIFVSCAAGA